MGAVESGAAFLAGVLAKIPEGLREQVKTAFEAPDAKDALITIGDGVLARSDYSKQMDAISAKEQELTTKYEELNTWWTVNKDALADYKTIKAAPGGEKPDPAKPVVAAPAEDPRKIVEEYLSEAGRDYVGVSAWLAAKVAEHFHTFNEPLNAMELVANPKLGKPVPGMPGRVYSLNDVYQEKFGERLATKQKEVDEQKFNAEVEKRLKERQGASTSHPFPLRDSPSVLDTLTAKDGSAVHTLDAAVAEYERLQQARAGA